MFSNIPLPPDAEPLIRETGTDAIQFVMVSRASPDSVVAYYRVVLSADPFRLVNERKSGNSTAFYAEQNGPSIWITVSPQREPGRAGGDRRRRQPIPVKAKP